ncbi:MAG: hypothetical protein IJA61_04085 [Clostridia bacterium]|nr:hypothetical protein [Clostridia bacterium]
MKKKDYEKPKAVLAKEGDSFDKFVNHLYEKGELNHLFSADGDDMADNRQREILYTQEELESDERDL